MIDNDTLLREAWKRRNNAVVNYQGRPVGTVAAHTLLTNPEKVAMFSLKTSLFRWTVQ